MVIKGNGSVFLSNVTDGSWAHKHTKLSKYVGLALVKINHIAVRTIQDFDKVKKMVAGKDHVVFSLRPGHVIHMFKHSIKCLNVVLIFEKIFFK